MKSQLMRLYKPRTNPREQRFLERMKTKIEQRGLKARLAKLKEESLDEGVAILAAEKYSSDQLHVRAAKAWLMAGMPEKAVDEVRRSGFKIEVAKFCVRYGLRSEMENLINEIATNYTVYASNFAYAIGAVDKAVELGLVHLGRGNIDMPDVFTQNRKILKRIAKRCTEEGKFGVAGRIYEELGCNWRAAHAYLDGGYFEDIQRMSQRMQRDDGHVCLGGLGSCRILKRAYKQSVEAGKATEEFEKRVDNEIVHSFPIKCSVIAGVGTMAATAILMAITGNPYYLVLIGGVIASIAAFSAGHKLGEEIIFSARNNRYTKRIKERTEPKIIQRSEIPPWPAIFRKGEESLQQPSEEDQAGKLFEEGGYYEAGLIYAKLGGNAAKAVECACMLEKTGKLEQARELKVLAFGKAYLLAEEVGRTNPDTAREMLTVMGIQPSNEDLHKH